MKRLQNATMIGWLVLCLVYTAGDVVALAAVHALFGHANIWSLSVTLKFGAVAINVMALTLMLAIFIKAWSDSRRGTWRHSEVKSMIFLYLICPGTSVKYLADLLASGMVSAPWGLSDAAAALRGTAILVNLIALALTLVILARSWSGCRQGGSDYGHWDEAQ